MGQSSVLTMARVLGSLIVLVLAVFVGSTATAGEDFERLPVLDPALAEKGWRVLTRSDIDPNRFTVGPDGSIEVRTETSNALIYRPVTEDEQFPARFRWRWRVDRSFPATDILVKGGDDRPVSVYLGFEVPPDRRGFFDGIRDALAELIVGIPISGLALTYTWGGTSPIGTMFNNPHLRDDSYVFVRRNGESPLQQWLTEEIDIAADFRAAFGIAPTRLRYIAIAADSEDSGASSLAIVSDLLLVGSSPQ